MQQNGEGRPFRQSGKPVYIALPRPVGGYGVFVLVNFPH